MFEKMFNHIDIMGRSMDSYTKRMEVNSANIANVDTPGYKAKRVSFDEAFSNALNAASFKGRKTSDRHIDIGARSVSDVRPIVYEDNTTTMRMDGNNVDIDQEMTDYAKNYIMYNTLTTKLTKEFGRLTSVIKDFR